MRRPRHVDDRERDEEVARDGPTEPAPAATSQAALLSLQRTAGNQAVSAMIARNGGPTAAPAAAETDEQLFDDAVTAGDWAKAAELIVKLSAPVPKLTPLTVDRLRLLQDALTRAGPALGGTGSVIMAAIGIELTRKGVPAGRLAAGAAFGTLETKVTERTNGDRAAGKGYAYKIEITFLPDTAVVDADEIAFIQTVRVVDTATGANKDPEETNKKRMTGTATSVDRLGGREQGWYGMKDDGSGGGTLRTWTKADPTKPAFMMDRPSWNEPDTTWEFETSAVCRTGADAGKVYATVTWGFRVGADLKLVELARVVTNKQSKEFTKAVENWNTQAAGPEADRNAPGQKSLPALK